MVRSLCVGLSNSEMLAAHSSSLPSVVLFAAMATVTRDAMPYLSLPGHIQCSACLWLMCNVRSCARQFFSAQRWCLPRLMSAAGVHWAQSHVVVGWVSCCSARPRNSFSCAPSCCAVQFFSCQFILLTAQFVIVPVGGCCARPPHRWSGDCPCLQRLFSVDHAHSTDADKDSVRDRTLRCAGCCSMDRRAFTG